MMRLARPFPRAREALGVSQPILSQSLCHFNIQE